MVVVSGGGYQWLYILVGSLVVNVGGGGFQWFSLEVYFSGCSCQWWSGGPC